MSDNKKYYYMKVRETFFDSEEMKLLESQVNGTKYQNLYLKLCLLSLKSNGALLFKDMFPYDITMLSTVLRVDIDTVKTGIELFQKLKLVDIIDDGTIYMSDIQSLIGKSSTEAERMAKYRKNIEIAIKPPVVQMFAECSPELELEKDIEKDIELDSEIEKEEDKTENPSLEEKKIYPENKKEYLPEFLKVWVKIERAGIFTLQLYRKNSDCTPVSEGLSTQEMMLSLLNGTFVEDWFVRVSEKQKPDLKYLQDMSWERIVSICSNPAIKEYTHETCLKEFLLNLHNTRRPNYSQFLSWISPPFSSVTPTCNDNIVDVTIPESVQLALKTLKSCSKFKPRDEKQLIYNLIFLDSWLKEEYSWIEEYNNGKHRDMYDTLPNMMEGFIYVMNHWESRSSFDESFVEYGKWGWNSYVKECRKNDVELELGLMSKKNIEAERKRKQMQAELDKEKKDEKD